MPWFASEAQVPVITNRLPAASSHRASPQGPIQLSFSQPMSAAAARPDAIRVVSGWRGQLPGTYTGAGTSTITFQPTPALLPGEPVRVGVLPTATSLSGTPAAPASYLFRAAVAPSTGVFPVPQEETVAWQPTNLQIADINQDGYADFLTANRKEASVSVRLGNGRGGFTTRPDVALGYIPEQVVIADVNKDGKPDFLVLHTLASLVQIRLGDGQGGFTGTGSVNPNNSPNQIALGDLNADGNLDMVISNTYPAAINIRMGDGKGNFTGTSYISLNQTPSNIALTDVNQDGKLDFVLTNTNKSSLSVGLGTGTGTFNNLKDLTVGTQPRELIVADVNRDDLPDLIFVVGSSSTTNGLLSIRLGDGKGGFTGGLPDVTAGIAPRQLLVRDVNADGNPDLLSANILSSTVSVRLGAGNGRFTGTAEVAVDHHPASLSLADVDSDGDLDLLTANEGIINDDNNTVSIRPGNGRGEFAGPLNLPVGAGPTHTATGDLNGDALLDLVTANETANTVSIHLGTGSGTFRPLPDLTVAAQPRFVALGDINNDGRLDLLTAHTNSVNVSARLGNGAGGFASATTVNMSGIPNVLVLTDCNHDGRLDLFGSNYGSNSVAVRLGNGQGGFTGTTNLPIGDSYGPYGLVADDVNQDGHPDLLVINSGIGINSMGVWLGNGQGGFSKLAETPAGGSPNCMDSGDINNDGHLDVVIGNFQEYKVTVLLGNGQGAFPATTPVASSRVVSDVKLGDVNGDGNLDLVTSIYLTRQLQVRYGDGTGQFSPTPQVLPVGVEPDGLVLADADGDGDLDILASCEQANYVAVRFNGSVQAPVLAAKAPAVSASAALPLSCYPNPTDDGLLTVDMTAFGRTTVELSVWTTLGQPVYTRQITRPEPAYTIALPVALPAGVYLVQIKAADGRRASGRIVRN
ncbi:FG-GAP-like repeat-containing protein [Hymenobacter sp. DG01]|uniref:FG-GAP-like repeat-containing protein n=1 Tax=Hymenobacter sp. DG01 TaxID=2584940 RepID=UPI0035B0CFB3